MSVVATTFAIAHHRQQRRLEDYYAYAENDWMQHPHYTISMLDLLGLLISFVLGYAIYQQCQRRGLLWNGTKRRLIHSEIGSLDSDHHGKDHCGNKEGSHVKLTANAHNNQSSSGNYVTMTDVRQGVPA
jgi:hypothetical protein